MASKRITGTADTYADDLATITTRNEYRDSMTMESTGEARPYMAIGRDEPVEALTALWFALHGEVAEDADEADEADEKLIADEADEYEAGYEAYREAADEAAYEAARTTPEDLIDYIRRVGGSDVAYSEPIGGTEAESRTWYDALATNWEHVARIGIIERYAFEANLTVRDMARKDRAQGWVNQPWRYGDHTMPLVWIGNPSKGIPMAVAPGRNGRGYERTSVRSVAEGAPIKNAITLAASIANGGAAVTVNTRMAGYRSAQTPEQKEIARAKDAARKAAKRNAAK